MAPRSKRGTFKVRLPLLVGRGEDAKLRIQHHQVSRRHCELFAGDDDVVYLRDLGSTNGTFLDGEQIPTSTRTVVRSGGLVRVGKVAFVVDLARAPPAPGTDRGDETQPGIDVSADAGGDDVSFAVQASGQQPEEAPLEQGWGMPGAADAAAESAADAEPAPEDEPAFPRVAAGEAVADAPQAWPDFAAAAASATGERAAGAALPIEQHVPPDAADDSAADDSADGAAGQAVAGNDDDAGQAAAVRAAKPTGDGNDDANLFAGFDPLGERSETGQGAAPAEDAEESASPGPSTGDAGHADPGFLDFLKKLS